VLRVAEHECPWGEMAENYRMLYLADRMDAASDGWTPETRDQARSSAAMIRARLFDRTADGE